MSFHSRSFWGWGSAACCRLPLPRYDFLLLWCLLVQVAMLATRLETRDELKVICLFHLIGLGLELFKTKMGSWSYPEAGLHESAGAGAALLRVYVRQCRQLYLSGMAALCA